MNMLGISHKRRVQFRHKIMLTMLLFLTIPFVAFCSFYVFRNWGNRVDDILKSYSSQLKTCVDNTNDILTESCYKADYINCNYDIGVFLSTEFVDDLPTMMTFYQNTRGIFRALAIDSYINSIRVFTFNKSVLSEEYIKKFQESDMYMKNEQDLKARILDPNNLSFVWKYRTIAEENRGKKTYICLYKRIMSVDEPLGITEIKIDFKNICEQFKFTIPEYSFILFIPNDGSESILLNSYKISEKDASVSAYDYLKNKKRSAYYIIPMKLKSNSDEVCMFIPKAHITNELRGFVIETVIAFAILATVIILATRAVSFYLTRRLSELISEMNRSVENLINSDETVAVVGDDEFARINMKFHELIYKIKEYYKKILEYEADKRGLELEKRSLEIDLLQARINPHFLYNTLSVIRFAFPNAKLEQVINSLSRYYRIALNKGENIIKVSQEIEMIEEYLKIQKFAYVSEFVYIIDIEESVKYRMVLKHLLQPVVENAFLHGICGMESGGLIEVKGRIVDGRIIFEISDNGAGMDPDKVSRILNGENISIYGGYGFISVRKRIETFYGGEYGIDINSTIGNGTKVIITIPE